LKILQENVTRGNQQTSVGSVVDYSQGSSATYFEVLDFYSFDFTILHLFERHGYNIYILSGKILIPRRTLRFLTIKK